LKGADQVQAVAVAIVAIAAALKIRPQILVLPAVPVVPVPSCRLITSMKSVRAGPRVPAAVKAQVESTFDWRMVAELEALTPKEVTAAAAAEIATEKQREQ